MKSKTKSEIAYACGMSRSTFTRWFSGHRAAIAELCVNLNARLLSPKAVRYICEEFGFIEEDFTEDRQVNFC